MRRAWRKANGTGFMALVGPWSFVRLPLAASYLVIQTPAQHLLTHLAGMARVAGNRQPALGLGNPLLRSYSDVTICVPKWALK